MRFAFCPGGVDYGLITNSMLPKRPGAIHGMSKNRIRHVTVVVPRARRIGLQIREQARHSSIAAVDERIRARMGCVYRQVPLLRKVIFTKVEGGPL